MKPADELEAISEAALERGGGKEYEVYPDHACAGDERMEKDCASCYATTNGLADDVERPLRDEPDVARPPSTLERLQKMFGMHPWHSEPPLVWAWLSCWRYW